MAIGFKKVEEMIASTVSEFTDLDETQRKVLIGLCKRIYTEEASALAAKKSYKTVWDDLRGDIANVSDNLFPGKDGDEEK